MTTAVSFDLSVFLARLKTAKSARTVRCYQTDIGQFIVFLGTRGEDPLTVTPAAIGDFLGSLKDICQPQTIRRKYYALRSLYLWLEKVQGLADPTKGIELDKGEWFEPEVVTSDQLAALIQLASGNRMTPRNAALLLLACTTSIRLSRILSMTVASVIQSEDKMVIHLEGPTIAGVPSQREVRIELGFTAGQALRRYLEKQGTTDPASPLWLNCFQKPLSTRHVRRLLRRWFAQVGINPEISVRALRNAVRISRANGDKRSAELSPKLRLALLAPRLRPVTA